MTVINTNVKSLISQNAMVKNNRDLSTAMQQLSTGKRINSAKDDAAGLAISSRMTAQVRGLDAAVRNANDGISLLQTAEGALIEVTNMLQRMRELSIQAANDTNTVDDRRFLDLEFQQLKEEINRIAKNTEWNGMGILDRSADAGNGAGKFEFQVGANANQLISITLKDFTTEAAVIGSPPRTVIEQSNGTVIPAPVTAPQLATPGTPAVPGTPEVPAVAQKSLITLSGTYAVGDQIKLAITLGSEVTPRNITYTVETGKTTISDITSGILGISGIDNTLGLTLQKDSSNRLELIGPAGVSFSAALTTTPVTTTSVGKVVTADAGLTTEGRQKDTVTLSGSFEVGDVLTFNNGTDSITYTVQASDAGSANLSTLTTNIRNSISGYFPNTLVDASGGVLTFTQTNTGATPVLAVTSSVAYKRDLDAFSTVTQAVAYVPATPGTPAQNPTPAIPQVNTISVGQKFFKNDVVNVQIDGQNFTYTVTEDDEKSSDPANAVVAGLTLKLLENPVAGINLTRNNNVIQLTGNSNGTPFVLNVSQNKADKVTQYPEEIAKEAGSLNMIKNNDILTRINADSSIVSLDNAIFSINEARAEMGAVMNRLSFAGDNLTNVSQNTSESRSRILDADYAKSSSELARTQIISQAATAMLAQANQSPQSVLQLLQG